MGRRRAQGQAGGRLLLAWGVLAWGGATSRLAGVRDGRGPRRPRPVVLRLGGHVHSAPWWFTMWLPHLPARPHRPTNRRIRKPMNRFATGFSTAAAATVNSRAGVRQFGHPRGASDRADPPRGSPLMRAETLAAPCATGARS